MPFSSPVNFSQSANQASVTHASSTASPTPWLITRVKSSAGDILNQGYWEFDPIHPLETMHVATLKLKAGYEIVNPILLTLFGLGDQISVKVRFADGGCETLLVNLGP